MNKRSGEETKKKILDAAGEIFADYGYSQANMRMIAASAGISVGCLYLYFRNKEDLCLTLMKESLDDFNRETSKMLREITDPQQAMAGFIGITINRAVERKERFLTLGREHGFSFGLELKKKFYNERRGMIEGIIRNGIEKKTFRQCDEKEMSKVIFNVLRGYITSLVIDDEDALFDAHECVNLILYGLLMDGAESSN
jgi:AcrR family transcriptional regulator